MVTSKTCRNIYLQPILQLLMIVPLKLSKAPLNLAVGLCLLGETFNHNIQVSTLNNNIANIMQKDDHIYLYVNFEGPTAAVLLARATGIEDKVEDGEVLIWFP